MSKLDTLLGFAIGYCVSDCIEKDYYLKPVFCTVACSIGSYYSLKFTAENTASFYDTIIKPGLKTFFIAGAGAGGNINRNMDKPSIAGALMPPVYVIAHRLRNFRNF
jgi:hypothetical protein